MTNFSFFKKSISEFSINNFCEFSQKYLSGAFFFTLASILENPSNRVVIISSSFTHEKIFEKAGFGKNVPGSAFDNKIFVVDCFPGVYNNYSNYSSIQNNSEKNNLVPQNILRPISVENLTSIQIQIDKAIELISKNFKGNIFVVFESVTAFGVYNDAESVSRFLHFFSNKARIQNFSTVYFSSKESIDESVENYLKQFCEKTFDFSKVVLD
jgi:hypothetical protein